MNIPHYGILQNQIMRIRGNLNNLPDASIIIPVDARKDFEYLLQHITDLTRYDGKYYLEIIPVINNYPRNHSPIEIEQFRQLGLQVTNIPNARVQGQLPSFSARMPGLKAAQSDITIHFNVDCRISNPTQLINFYITSLQEGVDLAYTAVRFYDLQKGFSVKLRIWIHHSSRWFKRNILRIPTARSSNYAIRRNLLLYLYNTRKLTEDIYVGQNLKAIGGRSKYSGKNKLAVHISGKRFKPDWKSLYRYLRERILFHIGYIGDTTAAEDLKKARYEKPRSKTSGPPND